jgi:hypothetical protein
MQPHPTLAKFTALLYNTTFMKKLLTTAFLFIVTIGLNATHITHGNMYCTFDRVDTNGNVHYLISLELYRDCKASQVKFDTQLEIGVYLSNKLNSTIIMPHDTEIYAAVQNIGDTTNQNFCYKKAFYKGFLVLPPIANDYTLVYQICCRPNVLTNIKGTDVSNTFYATVNPSKINSTPKNYASALFVSKVGQKQTLSLGGNDADGDILTYKMINAQYGDSATVRNPWPSPPKQIPSRFPDVPYNNNYSGILPLGNAPANAKLDSLTGQLELFAATQGIYIIAYEVVEWRNGSKINTNYREAYIKAIVTGSAKNNTILLGANGFNIGKTEIQTFWSHNIAATVDSFVVERSPDSTAWTEVGGTAPFLLNYLDGSVTANTTYWYRVYADTGGNKVYSNIVKVGVTAGGTTLGAATAKDINVTIYPSPATDKLFLEIPDNYRPENIIISDVLGKTVLTVDIEANMTQEINISALPAGVYFIKFDELLSIKFIKTN